MISLFVNPLYSLPKHHPFQFLVITVTWLDLTEVSSCFPFLLHPQVALRSHQRSRDLSPTGPRLVDAFPLLHPFQRVTYLSTCRTAVLVQQSHLSVKTRALTLVSVILLPKSRRNFSTIPPHINVHHTVAAHRRGLPCRLRAPGRGQQRGSSSRPALLVPASSWREPSLLHPVSRPEDSRARTGGCSPVHLSAASRLTPGLSCTFLESHFPSSVTHARSDSFQLASTSSERNQGRATEDNNILLL